MIPLTALNHTFTVLEPIQAQQANGEVVTTYLGSVTFAGALIARSGNEQHDANVERTEQRFQIVAVHRTDITAKKRLQEGSTVYQVEYPRDPSGRAQYILIDVVILA